MSFQITLKSNRKAAARFIGDVRRAILKAYAEEQKASGLTQTDIARAIGVHRSVINRELKGFKDMTLGRVAELAWACNRKPKILMEQIAQASGTNAPQGALAVKTNLTVDRVTEAEDATPTTDNRTVQFRAVATAEAA
jgi:hypothetical protein